MLSDDEERNEIGRGLKDYSEHSPIDVRLMEILTQQELSRRDSDSKDGFSVEGIPSNI